MEDKQYRYLDKVVEFLVRDTIIDYDREGIKYPFLLSFFLFSSLFSSSPFSFSTYVRDVYGLTDPEIYYVWEQYRNIINKKI
jgi:hypothetical protein